MKTDPSPRRLSTAIVPPSASITWRTIHSPRPNPPTCPRRRSLQALEDLRQVRRGDAHAVVPDDEARPVGLAPDADLDRVIFAVLDGVREQIRDDLVDAHAVPSTDDRLALDPHSHELALGLRVTVDHFAHERAELDVLHVEANAARHDARDVEQVVDQARHASHLLLRARRVALESFLGERLLARVPGKELDAKLQRRERRSQLVRGQRDERVPQAHGVPALVAGRPQDQRRRGDDDHERLEVQQAVREARHLERASPRGRPRDGHGGHDEVRPRRASGAEAKARPDEEREDGVRLAQ